MTPAQWLERAYDSWRSQRAKYGVIQYNTPGDAYLRMFKMTRSPGLASIKRDHEAEWVEKSGEHHCPWCNDSPDLIVVE